MAKTTRMTPWTRLLGWRHCYLGSCRLDPERAAPVLPEGLHVSSFRAPDLQILGRDAMDPSMTEHRIGLGDRPWGLWEGRNLLCYGWSSTRETAILSLATLTPGADEAYLYGFYTPPRYRGHGYYPLLLKTICAHLAQGGARRAWIAVFAENPASWKGVLKAGFTKAATQLTLTGRLSLVLPESDAPQPQLKPRRRGLHLRMARGAGSARRGPSAS